MSSTPRKLKYSASGFYAPQFQQELISVYSSQRRRSFATLLRPSSTWHSRAAKDFPTESSIINLKTLTRRNKVSWSRWGNSQLGFAGWEWETKNGHEAKASGTMMSWETERGSGEGAAVQSDGKIDLRSQDSSWNWLGSTNTWRESFPIRPVSHYHHVHVIKDSNMIQFHSRNKGDETVSPWLWAQSSPEKVLPSVPHSRTLRK